MLLLEVGHFLFERGDLCLEDHVFRPEIINDIQKRKKDLMRFRQGGGKLNGGSIAANGKMF